MRDIEYINAPWGHHETYAKNENCTVKLIFVRPGMRLSRQYHKNRDEFWKVIFGPVIIEINGFTKTLQAGETCEIPRGSVHRLTCPPGFVHYAVVLEVATGDFDELDIIRLEDDFSRHIVNIN